MPNLKIAIVDSGLDTNHDRLKNIHNLKGYNALDKSGNIADEDMRGGKGGHGTGVVSVLHQHIKEDLEKIELHIVKVFDKQGFTSETLLLDSIRYCIDKEIDIINLSLGIETPEPTQQLSQICQEAYDKGTIIISSSSDNSVSTYPAYFPFVFGVVGGIIDSRKDYGILDTELDFIGKGNLQRIANIDNQYAFKAGNSYATAHITGIIANLLLKDSKLSFEEIKERLRADAKNDIRIFSNRSMQFIDPSGWIGNRVKPTVEKVNEELNNFFNRDVRFSWMKNIAIYPMNSKEMKSFLHFSDLCSFNIKEIYDFPKFAARNKTVQIQNKTIDVKWDIDENSFSEVDTIVIGHPYDTAVELNTRFADKIIDRCIELKKNFFVFDRYVYLELKNKVKDSVVYHPSDIKELIGLLNTVKVNESKLPILAVVGTSPQCGKFTTQLSIKRILEKQGYKTGFLSTEPQGELFGADISFPIGNEISGISLGHYPYLLNSIVNGIEQHLKPDIFITGHQSGFLKADKSPFKRDTLQSLNFISSINPDGIVCAINPAYDKNQLERVVSALKIVFQKEVVFFTLSKKKVEAHRTANNDVYLKNVIISNEDWQQIADEITETYNKPVVDTLDSKSEQVIIDTITSFFSKS